MAAQTSPTAAPAAETRSAPLRAFGRFALRQLLGKSERSMAWLAFDPRLNQDVMIALPRVQPADAVALEHWQREVKRAARLNHPNLAHVVEVGVQDHWPFVAVDRALGITLKERLDTHPRNTPLEVVHWVVQALQGLAFVHDAGLAHHDLQLHNLLINDQGQVRVMALTVAGDHAAAAQHAASMDAAHLRAQRDAAQTDLLACGVLLHQLLAAAPVLDESDTAKVIARLPPLGRDLVRLPWGTPHPIPEALRAIANRCTAGQERQRYQAARTLLRALEGWRQAESQDSGGPLALLLDRLRSVGHLPAMPGVTARVAKLSGAESQRTDEMAEEVLNDMALSFELLRTVNSAQVLGSQLGGNGPVLTVRRAIALLGVNGVRTAANALRHWPGPLGEAGAAALQRCIAQVRLAGHTAQALRPRGYDPEVVFIVAVLQNLGWLLVQYHFPDEAAQVRQLMQAAPPPPGAEPGTPEQPGMSEEGAAFAVLGVDIDALGAAVARHWGLGDEVQQMMRRVPLGKSVRQADSDADLLRCTSSAANEVVDAAARLPAARLGAALTQVAQRYGRVLGVNSRDVGDALQSARHAVRSGARVVPAERAAEPADESTEHEEAAAPVAANPAAGAAPER